MCTELKENTAGLNFDMCLFPRVCVYVWPRLISEKPAESHTVGVSVMEVYNNEVFDLLARDEQGNAVSQHRDVITTSSGTSHVPSLTYEWVQPELRWLCVFICKGREYEILAVVIFKPN